MNPNITFVVPIGDEHIYAQCFAKSPLLASGAAVEVFGQRGFKTAAAAFNEAIQRSRNDLMIFCHQDIVLPAGWDAGFLTEIQKVSGVAPNWGVVGCAGITADGRVAAHIYRHDRELASSVPLPAEVRTLDECLVAFRRSSALRFDKDLPGFFYYAADICLQAESLGRLNYAIDAPCVHRSKSRVSLPASLYVAERYFIRKWSTRLPVPTLSGTVGGRKSLAIRRVKDGLRAATARIGWRPRPWWAALPQVDLEAILAPLAKAQDGKPRSQPE